jgi:signal transduction histidine kinase
MGSGTFIVVALALALAIALAALARARAGRARVEADRDALADRVEGLVHEYDADRARLVAAARESREEAERADRVRENIVAMVSHELRTPLNAVLGWARLLRSGRLDAAETARAVETIERSASAQAQLVDDLLDVARIAKGELRLDVRTVELVPVIEAAIAAVRPAAEARGIAVASVLMPSAGPVSGDPGRLQQVVWNLLSNAVKFTPPGGRIEVRLDPEPDAAVVRVKDTGEGIAPEFTPHLFEPFRQADSSSTRLHGGAGLGLAIVRHVVEAHGGTVEADSAGRGKGATFTVRLPATARRARGVASPGPRPPGPAAAAAPERT